MGKNFKKIKRKKHKIDGEEKDNEKENNKN